MRRLSREASIHFDLEGELSDNASVHRKVCLMASTSQTGLSVLNEGVE